jgi:hypothetical protein
MRGHMEREDQLGMKAASLAGKQGGLANSSESTAERPFESM